MVTSLEGNLSAPYPHRDQAPQCPQQQQARKFSAWCFPPSSWETVEKNRPHFFIFNSNHFAVLSILHPKFCLNLFLCFQSLMQFFFSSISHFQLKYLLNGQQTLSRILGLLYSISFYIHLQSRPSKLQI